MKQNVIYAAKNKLGGIDSVLPLLMELKHRYPKVNILVLFYDEEHFRGVEQNYHIMKALHEMGATSFVMRHRWKLKSLVSLLGVSMRMVFRRNIIIKGSDVIPKHTHFVDIMKKFSSVFEVFADISNYTLEGHMLAQIPLQLNRERARQARALSQGYSAGKEFEPNKAERYDYYISSLDREYLKHIYRVEVPEDKFVRIGYNRKLPVWTSYLNGESERLKSEGDYFVYYLSGTEFVKRMPHIDDPSSGLMLQESLAVLKKFNPYIKTIFKPHFVSDMNIFQRLIDEVGYENYAVDYGHPMILAHKARFVFGNWYSAVVFDAYYLGIPTVLYLGFEEEVFRLQGGKTTGGDACDFFVNRDPERLDTVIRMLLEGQVKVRRDEEFIERNFSDTPREFWAFWDSLLKKNHKVSNR